MTSHIGALDMDATINVPKSLVGNFAVSGSIVQLTFPRSTTRARLRFSDPDFTADLGGDILGVASEVYLVSLPDLSSPF